MDFYKTTFQHGEGGGEAGNKPQCTNIDKSLYTSERNYHVKKSKLIELYWTITTEKLQSIPITALSEVSESQPAAAAGHLMYFPASHGTCRLQRVSARLLESNSASLGYQERTLASKYLRSYCFIYLRWLTTCL